MAISQYIRSLRIHVGTARLLLPSASVHIFDKAGRLLLVRQRDDESWSTPGGVIEPDERPADAAKREAWEETGLHVNPDRVLGIYGGPECIVRYPNGDETQYVIIAFGCTVLGGQLRADNDETTALQYWTEVQAESLRLAPWLRPRLPTIYARSAAVAFEPATWEPPGPRRLAAT